jgi:hypothetical protein
VKGCVGHPPEEAVLCRCEPIAGAARQRPRRARAKPLTAAMSRKKWNLSRARKLYATLSIRKLAAQQRLRFTRIIFPYSILRRLSKLISFASASAPDTGTDFTERARLSIAAIISSGDVLASLN